MRLVVLIVLAVATALLLAGCHSVPPTASAAPAFHFVDVTAKAGITWQRSNGAFGKMYYPEVMGGGGAFIDYDNDGYQDILLINGDWWPGHPQPGVRPTLALYHNNRNGTFTDVTVRMGLNVSMQGMGVAVGDYDNDGYDDLLITSLGGNHLYHNEQGKRFKDVTGESGLGGSGWTTSAAWLDYDNDGKLDLFVGHYIKWTVATDIYCGGAFKIYCTPNAYPCDTCRLYHNDGSGHFTDVTAKAGLFNNGAKALGVCTFDIDQNGKPDLIVANDSEPNFAYRNEGNGKFKDISGESGLALGDDGKPRNGMGIDAADYGNDGVPGVLTGNFSFQGVGLHREVQPGLFQDVSGPAGLQSPSTPYVTFGVLFCDIDNDGWKDVVITNGHTDTMAERTLPGQHFLQPTQIFRNRGNGTFADVSAQSGPGVPQAMAGRGLAWGDLDNDGRPDLLLIPNTGSPRLLHNESPGNNHWLLLVPEGVRSNRDGYGALVRVTAAGMTQSDMARSGSSYCSASDRRLHFGLGAADHAETLDIRWPSGQHDTWHNIAADHVWRLREGSVPTLSR